MEPKAREGVEENRKPYGDHSRKVRNVHGKEMIILLCGYFGVVGYSETGFLVSRKNYGADTVSLLYCRVTERTKKRVKTEHTSLPRGTEAFGENEYVTDIFGRRPIFFTFLSERIIARHRWH